MSISPTKKKGLQLSERAFFVYSMLTSIWPVAASRRGPESRPGATASGSVLDVKDEDTIPVVPVALEPERLAGSRLGVISTELESAVLAGTVHAEGGGRALIDVLNRPARLISRGGEGESS